MTRSILFALPALLLAARPMSAQSIPTKNAVNTPAPAADDHYTGRPRAMATERTAPVVLDGALTEAVWSAGTPATDFRQFEPNEGQPGQRTEIRFAYDEQALYIGARMYDSLGGAGVRTRLVRRDQISEGDNLQ